MKELGDENRRLKKMSAEENGTGLIEQGTLMKGNNRQSLMCLLWVKPELIKRTAKNLKMN